MSNEKEPNNIHEQPPTAAAKETPAEQQISKEKESRETLRITGKFEQGDRVPICRNPSDGGAWVVPERGSILPQLGIPYVLEITKTIAGGRLRCVQIVETLKKFLELQKTKFRPLVEQALLDPNSITTTYRTEGGNRRTVVKVKVGSHTFTLFRGRGGDSDYLSTPWGDKDNEDWIKITPAVKEKFNSLEREDGERRKENEEKQKKENAERNERDRIRLARLAEARAEEVVKDAKKVNQFFQKHPEARSWFQAEKTGAYTKIYEDHLKELLQKGGVDLNLTWNEVFAKAKYKTAELESDPKIRKEKEKVMAMAAQMDSENGPLGAWPPARLDEAPDAGALIQVDGKWYVAVAGVPREGTKGNYGGLYARWVQVPASECNGW